MAKKLLSLMVGAAASVATLGMSVDASAEIKIGSTLAITGPASFLGDPEAKTLKMYVDAINAAGGVNGEQITLVQYDDGADPNKARTFATRLIEDDEVSVVIGPSTTGATMAIIPLFEEAEVPLISLAGGDPITSPTKKWAFAMPHTAKMACGKIFADMQKRGFTKVGMISGTGGFGKSMRMMCLETAGDYGIEIVADESYGGKDQDMTPQLTNIKSTDGVQAVINPGFGQGPAIVTRNYRQLQMDIPLYQSHGVASKSFIDLAGDAAEGVRLPVGSLLVADQLADDDPQKAVVMDYIKTYEAETGEPVSTFGGYAYDALHMVVDAIKRAGSSEPAAIRDALEQTQNFVGVGGTFNMSADDHLGLDLSAFKMVEIQSGDWKLVE